MNKVNGYVINLFDADQSNLLHKFIVPELKRVRFQMCIEKT